MIKKIMDISKLTTQQLFEELQKRDAEEKVKNNEENYLIVGTSGMYQGKIFVEHFKIAETYKDLDFLEVASLRARFNSYRDYRGFYFKTTKANFETLKKNHEALRTLIGESKPVKFFQLW